MAARLRHLVKALMPMESIALDKLMLVNPEQPQKAALPMAVKLAGVVIPVRPVQ